MDMINGTAMMMKTMMLAGIAKGQNIFTFSLLSMIDVSMIVTFMIFSK
jgi:hypothetical protein